MTYTEMGGLEAGVGQPWSVCGKGLEYIENLKHWFLGKRRCHLDEVRLQPSLNVVPLSEYNLSNRMADVNGYSDCKGTLQFCAQCRETCINCHWSLQFILSICKCCL